ncbi:MAG: glycosyltransferase family 2 protein [Gammaproteobacteria bacterium]|nr:glycosyltransferase family 2 protein [Gammaproteobacteria bacterium]
MHATSTATPPARAPDFSVVIPCFNERDNVLALVREIAASCAGQNFEIVVVDDASTDGSGEHLLGAVGEFGGQLRVVRHVQTRGQSAGICTGIDYAQGRCIVTLDGDGQNDPHDIPALLARLAASEVSTIVCGYRRTRRDTWLRRWSSRVANTVRAGLLGDATPDTGCGLKAFERALFMRLPRFNHMHRFLPALAQREGACAVSVEVHHRARRHGQSKYGVGNRLWVGIVDLFGVLWLRRRGLPPVPSTELTPHAARP